MQGERVMLRYVVNLKLIKKPHFDLHKINGIFLQSMTYDYVLL